MPEGCEDALLGNLESWRKVRNHYCRQLHAVAQDWQICRKKVVYYKESLYLYVRIQTAKWLLCFCLINRVLGLCTVVVKHFSCFPVQVMIRIICVCVKEEIFSVYFLWRNECDAKPLHSDNLLCCLVQSYQHWIEFDDGVVLSVTSLSIMEIVL